ncbi:MAG TPA: SRPBCC family protein [Anaerolineales bacterium]|nr:SRPBCC family protein [Anaerolineales bacterium]
MKSQTARATRIINAPAETIYNIIADFRNQHGQILPTQYFQALEVEEGGFGAGTITRFQMTLLGQTKSFRTLITEPEPGRVLIETDIQSGTPTTFTVSPLEDGDGSRVEIATELRSENMAENLIGKFMLQKVYRAELELLARQAEKQGLLVNSASAN